ncbi:16S rRNA pseudouridine(516) synthase [Mycoplasmopsis bovirhinis]|uniref:Pseudouridine synthase n=1 Tax=Mycoplasmopsis bovirhinis TaxID=29553 RepID=A0A224AXK7_9BACT|nr:RNA pseudouridine synthase [Mycoplasmopsis bovirhinis]BBA22088.1 16S rRNA pseudouridine(516) synthase [Mycoplasmopsis bovirhinis]VEU63572.1 Pseudouridine synthase [Mycoplasmopsis bovirhinis]
MQLRLDKFISNNTKYSRKEVKELILENKVLVDNIVIKNPGFIITESSKVTVNNFLIQNYSNVYIILNKPKNYVCSNYDKINPTVFELLPPNLQNIKGLHAVGRLDLDTTGLLLITNDGNFSHKLTSPKKQLFKTYYAVLDKEIDPKIIDVFSQGFELKDFKTLPAKLKIVKSKEAILEISEGKFHQVKRMFAKFGLKVLNLTRLKIGNFVLPKELKEGQIQLITLTQLEKQIYNKK